MAVIKMIIDTAFNVSQKFFLWKNMQKNAFDCKTKTQSQNVAAWMGPNTKYALFIPNHFTDLLPINLINCKMFFLL